MADFGYELLEDLVLVKILQTRFLPTFLLDKVDNSWWSSADRRQAWWDITSHYSRYGTVPSVQTFQKFLHPWVYDQSLDPSEPWDFYIDKFLDRQVLWNFEQLTDDVGDTMSSATREPSAMEDVTDLLKVFVDKSHGLRAEKTMIDAYNQSAAWAQRMDDYAQGNALTSGGINCGFSHIDSSTRGIHPGQLWTLFAPPKSFKTSSLCFMASHFQKQGKRVLFVSFEMTEREVLDRIDGIHSSLSLASVRDGNLTADQADHIRRQTEGLVSMYIQSGHGKETVSGVQGLVTEFSPDVVIVDGAYFLRDPESKERGTPRALTNVTRDFKRLATVSDVPVLISTQALTWKMNKSQRISADSIGYSSSFGQDSDLVVGLKRVDPTSASDDVEMDIVLARNGPLVQSLVTWDWKNSSWKYSTARDLPEDDDDDPDA